MAGETFGEGLRRWREEVNGLSLRDLAARSNVSKTRISDLENGRPPAPSIAKRLDEVLGAGGALMTLAAAGGATTGTLMVARSVPFDMYRHADLATRLLAGGLGGSADMDRRDFVLGLGGTVALGMIAPALGAETARHGLTLALVQERAAADVDEWREIVEEYGYDYLRLSPDELIQPLMIDLLGLQIATTTASESVRHELQKAGALLAAFTAMTVANLGYVREARRWWRSARRIAHESNDPDTILWVCGREVVRSLYEMRPVQMILDLADRAEAYAATGRPDSLPELLSGKAQAFALAGRSAEALATLDRVRVVYEGLESRASEQESLFDWPESRLRFTESYVYSHLGDLAHADTAQERAVQIYPRQYLRGPAQIEIQRALCLVKAGDISGGARHAHQIIERLPTKDRIRPIIDLGNTVLRNVAPDDRHLAAVGDFRDYLASVEIS